MGSMEKQREIQNVVMILFDMLYIYVPLELYLLTLFVESVHNINVGFFKYNTVSGLFIL